VREDVENRAVSNEAARAIYGVILSDDGTVDRAATDRLREERRQSRRRKDGPVQRLEGEELLRVTDNLSVRKRGNRAHHCCAKCAADLGPIDDNYKDHCVIQHEDIRTSNPNIGDWRRYLNEAPQFRQYYCPGCGALIENEIAMAGDPVLRDIEVRLG
jgi:N-methylhydantoinase B